MINDITVEWMKEDIYSSGKFTTCPLDYHGNKCGCKTSKRKDIMALTKCSECQTEVSDTALKCPKCGVQLRKPTRTTFGKIVKWGFIAFNVLMLIWLVAGLNAASEGAGTMSDAEAVGAGIGAMFIFFIWGFGDIVGGIMLLVTRPKS